jgi:hypothetical protein
MESSPEGFGVFDTWEVGVDPCHLCEREATAAIILLEPIRMALFCPEHAEESAIRMPPGGATCMATIPQETGGAVPCGAAATHVQLIGHRDPAGEPRLDFSAVCRRHANVD